MYPEHRVDGGVGHLLSDFLMVMCAHGWEREEKEGEEGEDKPAAVAHMRAR